MQLLLRLNIIGCPCRTESERTVLSGLCLDAADADLWLVFGILAQHKALKQHAFIQALRVDAYHALTWAHLGQACIDFLTFHFLPL